MRLSIAAVAATCAAALASCQLSSDKIHDHWNIDSVVPRALRTVTGYDPSIESSYKDFAFDRKRHVSLTARRFLLNHNPANPNQAPVESYFEPRPLNSLAPNPWYYLHLEGFALGAVATGIPVPIPIDSILGTIEKGGVEEFAAGFNAIGSKKGVITSADARSFYGENGELPPFEMTSKAR